ncbi:MAG: NAD(P)-binding protein [Rhizobiales bacterium]|nr:NAD(P)-binding protein [Hyphomicrobiales bacterium]
MFGPDLPFAYDDWLSSPEGLGVLPGERHGTRIAVIGSGIGGLVAAYELMRIGLQPVVYEAGRLGGRLRSEPFEGADGIIAELGGMRFPRSSSAFWHYADKIGVERRPFPNPLTEAAGSTVIDLEGVSHHARTLADLPVIFREVAEAYDAALEEGARFSDLKAAIARRDWRAIKEIWDPIVEAWDERTFYDFVASSSSFRRLSFHHREVFGQVGFGTGGWDSDFPNSMLEILRVNATECDAEQFFIAGGVEQVPQGLWRRPCDRPTHWPAGVSLSALNGGAPRPGVVALSRDGDGDFLVRDRWGRTDRFPVVVVATQSWMLTTSITTEERLFSPKLWMALDRTRYMQSAKTFVMVDRPFWKDVDPTTGRNVMSMTLTDRLTRGTYLFDNGDDRPGVICLSYTWMSDALKVLPMPVDRRVSLALEALAKIYPGLDIASHVIGDPITVSWESDPNFLGAFKGALPGHYRYNHRMFGHFMQEGLAPAERGIFLVGDDVSWTPGWVEGAVQTALNTVWGVVRHLGGGTPAGNPGPGDVWAERGPVRLSD